LSFGKTHNKSVSNKLTLAAVEKRREPLFKEFLRKTIHLTGLVVPVGYAYFPRRYLLILLTAGLLVAFAVELLRFSYLPFRMLFERTLGFLLREGEQRQICGATYWLIGAFLVVLFFPRPIAQFSLYMLIVSDSIAAWVGRSVGRVHLINGKTLEGSTAFLISAFLIGLCIPGYTVATAFVGAFAGMLFELGLVPLNDNLMIPVGSALVLFFFQKG